MSKIPKEIVDKIEQRNALNEEIAKWCKENLGMDGMNSDFSGCRWRDFLRWLEKRIRLVSYNKSCERLSNRLWT